MALPAPESIADATAYWLYTEDEGWERWRLVPASPTLSPNGQVLRLQLEFEGDRFELVLIERESRLLVKFDQRDEPEQELAAEAFRSADDWIVRFAHKDETVFLQLELDV